MKAKAKPSSQRKKGNLSFSQTLALTTTKHCAKHFLSQGKLAFAAYIVLSISYYRLYTQSNTFTTSEILYVPMEIPIKDLQPL